MADIGKCTCPDSTTLPQYDMDGSVFSAQPCSACYAAEVAGQKQSAEWATAGKCMGCGADNPLTGLGYCKTCMDEYCSAMAGVPHQE